MSLEGRGFMQNSFVWDISSLIYVHYGLMEVYFIRWIIVQCHFLRLLQLWPLRAFSFGFCVSLTHPIIVLISERFLTHRHQCSADTCCFLPQPQNQPFLQGGLIPFIGEWCQKPETTSALFSHLSVDSARNTGSPWVTSDLMNAVSWLRRHLPFIY